MANTNAEIIALLQTDPSQAIRGVLDTLYLYNPATVNDLIAQLNDVINKVGFEAIVVDALPETGKKGTIYFVPSGGETPNIYNEYVWVTETEKFEMVGSAQVDLSNYYTKEEVDNALKGLDPLPDQTDNAGKFLTTDGATASWSDKPLVNNATSESGIGIGLRAISTADTSVAIGRDSQAKGLYTTAYGDSAWSYSTFGTAIGGQAVSKALHAHQLGRGTNTDAYTFKVANGNGNFEIMSADGTIPTDRYTITPTAAGTYVPKLTIAEDGTTTREWGTESGGGGGDYLPTTGGTLTGTLSFDVTGGTYTFVPIIVNAKGDSLISAFTDSTGKTKGTLVKIKDLRVDEVKPTKIGGAYDAAQHIYVAKIGSGKDASLLTVPDGTGTLARLEDLEGLGGADLPDQTDNAGKFLMTDGENTSWANAVENKATTAGLNITSLGGAENTQDRGGNSIVIGSNIFGGERNDYGSIRIGKNINTRKTQYGNGVYIAPNGIDYAQGGIIISGYTNSVEGNTSGYSGGILINGHGNCKIGGNAGAYSICINSAGFDSDIILNASYSTFINSGYGANATITENNTFWWGNNNGFYKIVDADGTIPTDRYTTTPTTAGTYVPKLTIAEDGTATREWGTESGGASGDYLLKTDAAATYLPLSGGAIQYLTLTNNANYIGFKLSGSYKVSMRPLNPEMLTTTAGLGLSETILSFGWDDWSARFRLFLDTGTQKLFPNADNSFSLGLSERRWVNIYTYKLNNGADLIVPTEGGTLARIEDINAAVGDISTALTAILGE